MSLFIPNMKTSVGKKVIMGLSGLFLILFSLGHLVGNTMIMRSAEAFNMYGHFLITNPLIYFAEFMIVAFFLTHLIMGLHLAWVNFRARPIRYAYKHKEVQNATFASKTMPYTGIIFITFLVFHILQFKYGAHYVATYAGLEVRDLYRLLLEYFSNPLHVAWYIFAMFAIGIHVSHGFWSLFQSLGLNHPRYMPAIQVVSKLYGVVIAIGYSSLPIFCYLQGVQ